MTICTLVVLAVVLPAACLFMAMIVGATYGATLWAVILLARMVAAAWRRMVVLATALAAA